MYVRYDGVMVLTDDGLKRFLRWHGRLGTLIYASALTAVITGVHAQLDQGSGPCH
jgi:hypothetical protein